MDSGRGGRVPAGRIAAQEHRARSVGIEDGDYLVGATALEFELSLLTGNVRHFPMLPGLDQGSPPELAASYEAEQPPPEYEPEADAERRGPEAMRNLRGF